MQRQMAHLETADDGGRRSSAAAAAAAVIAATVSICLGLVWASVADTIAAAAIAAAAAGVAPHSEEARKCYCAAGGPQAEVPSLARDVHAYLCKSQTLA